LDDHVVVLALPFLIGFFAGLRSLTAPAATAWAAHLGWLNVQGPLAWIGSTPAVAILTALALLELIGDKLPSTPSRTAPPGLIARIVMGGLSGACVGSAGGAAEGGALLGILGALAGTFGGYLARINLGRALGAPDLAVAIVEDVVAIAGSLWTVS
jgi:uncharacterized membrane protein